MIEERLRLPMYLQLAGRTDEGRSELERLKTTYRDRFSQAVIANQMAVFSRKSGELVEALVFGAWALCKQRECDLWSNQDMIAMADTQLEHDAQWQRLGLPTMPPPAQTGVTPIGNPIRAVGYP